MYLEHHGILGMKWGIRRYQNKDGSLTAEGKKRYSIKENADDSFVLGKGSTLYRIANQEDKSNKERYYSVTEPDRMRYQELLDFGGLFLDRNKPYGEFINETNSDLKIRKGEAVVQDLINKYGKDSAEELTKHFENQKSLRKEIQDREKRNEYISEIDFDADDDNLYKQLDAQVSYQKVNDFVWDIMKNHSDEVVKNYRDMGYDGLVDPFDFVANVSDMPIIVINPKEEVSQKSFSNYKR
jgi:hypothetical protein